MAGPNALRIAALRSWPFDLPAAAITTMQIRNYQTTGMDRAFQMWVAYSEIVRSLEKKSEFATLRMALVAHPSRSA